MTFGAFWGELQHKKDWLTFTMHTVKESTTGQITSTWHLLEMTKEKKAESHQNFRLTPQKQLQFLGQTARGRCRFIAELHCAAVSSWLLSLVQQEGAKKRKRKKKGRGRRSKTRVAQ